MNAFAPTGLLKTIFHKPHDLLVVDDWISPIIIILLLGTAN